MSGVYQVFTEFVSSCHFISVNSFLLECLVRLLVETLRETQLSAPVCAFILGRGCQTSSGAFIISDVSLLAGYCSSRGQRKQPIDGSGDPLIHAPGLLPGLNTLGSEVSVGPAGGLLPLPWRFYPVWVTSVEQR